MLPCQNNPSVSEVQTAINCMLLCFLQATFVLYSLFFFRGCTESDLMHYSPPLALATLVSLLFLGHSLWSECRYQNRAQALLNHMPKLAWFLNQPSDRQLERHSVGDEQKNWLQVLRSSAIPGGFLRIFLCLALLEALILVLGELLKLPSSLFPHQSEGGLHLPSEQFKMSFSWSCSPSLPRAQGPATVLISQGQQQFWGWCSSPNPRTSPALELSQLATSQISQSCLLAARDFAVWPRQVSENWFNSLGNFSRVTCAP